MSGSGGGVFGVWCGDVSSLAWSDTRGRLLGGYVAIAIGGGAADGGGGVPLGIWLCVSGGDAVRRRTPLRRLRRRAAVGVGGVGSGVNPSWTAATHNPGGCRRMRLERCSRGWGVRGSRRRRLTASVTSLADWRWARRRVTRIGCARYGWSRRAPTERRVGHHRRRHPPTAAPATPGRRLRLRLRLRSPPTASSVGQLGAGVRVRPGATVSLADASVKAAGRTGIGSSNAVDDVREGGALTINGTRATRERTTDATAHAA